MVAFETAVGDLVQFLAPMWVEILFMVCFAIGFVFFPRSKSGQRGKKGQDEKVTLLHKQIGVDVAAGHCVAAMKSWHAAKALAPAPLEALRAVVQMLLEVHPDAVVEEMVEHFTIHDRVLSSSKSANVVLDVVARAGRVDLLDELASEFRQKLHISPNIQTYEVLLGGHASAGNEPKVSELWSEMLEARQKMTARGFSLTIKGFLKNGMVDAALRQIQDMHRKGFFIPSFAVAQLFRTAVANNRCAEIFDAVSESVALVLPQEAIGVLLEDCCKRNDLTLALRIEKIVRKGKSHLDSSAYDSLLKICVAHADVHACELFQSMQTEGLRISEGLCIGLLARCADSKFLRFAEEIATFKRSRDGFSIQCYSALMKVYAYCGLYDKACDLYAQIKADGLVPDSMMYGCLMKFSVECGRTELSQELFDKSPSLDIQKYMSMIRAAGRDKDVDRAFAVLERLKESSVHVDIAAYNCVLDACVSCGDVKRGRKLMSEMSTIATLDVITYNTLMKGYCSKNDLHGAKGLLVEMDQAGVTPNDVSYNCLINVAVSTGNFREAWNIIDMMEHNGVSVDHYTISIMMKALKKARDSKDVVRALQLLDRSGVEVCSDEILLNTVLETCTRHRQLPRVESILASFAKSNMRPSVHTYGSVIKACSLVKDLDKCYRFWHSMVDECALEPNEIVLGCMLDAIVCNGDTEDAITLLRKWKPKIVPNTVMYSTIIKGFAMNHKPTRAMDMWKEMCELGLTFNTVVFNALIDSQARLGAMEKVSELVKSMEPHGCSPDSITYSTIVKGYCIQGELDMAYDVFRTMQKNGMTHDSIVYNTIMDGCTRHNRMDLVDLVLEDMTKYNIKPSNFTLGILVKMYGRRHQLDKAFKVVDELAKQHGLQVNAQVRTCLMCACLSNHKLESAMKVFEDIKKAGGADSKAYHAMITGLVRLGALDKAVALVKEVYGLDKASQRVLPAGQVPQADGIEQLMRALGQKGLMQSVGVPLLEQLRTAQVPISGRLFRVVNEPSA